MTGRCVTVTGKRVAADFFITSYNARPKRQQSQSPCRATVRYACAGPGIEAVSAGVGYRLITAD
jgi:hypothetical protein